MAAKAACHGWLFFFLGLILGVMAKDIIADSAGLNFRTPVTTNN